MTHLMKFTKGMLGHIYAHYDRRENEIDNDNIDREQTHLNYNLATHQTKM